VRQEVVGGKAGGLIPAELRGHNHAVQKSAWMSAGGGCEKGRDTMVDWHRPRGYPYESKNK